MTAATRRRAAVALVAAVALAAGGLVGAALLGREPIVAPTGVHSRIWVIVAPEPPDSIDPRLRDIAELRVRSPFVQLDTMTFFSVETPTLRFGEPFDSTFPTGRFRVVVERPSNGGYPFRISITPTDASDNYSPPTHAHINGALSVIAPYDGGTLIAVVELGTVPFTTTSLGAVPARLRALRPSAVVATHD